MVCRGKIRNRSRHNSTKSCRGKISNFTARHHLYCDWLKVYRNIIQLDRDMLSVLWMVEIISRHNWIISRSMCRVLTQTANHTVMHHGACMTHVPWCMLGSLTNGFLWNRWRGKRSRRMRNPQFYVSGKRHIGLFLLRYRKIEYLTFKSQGQCHGQGQNGWPHLRPSIQSTCLFYRFETIGPFSHFHIWPWNFKVKVMARVFCRRQLLIRASDSCLERQSPYLKPIVQSTFRFVVIGPFFPHI